MGVMEMSHRSKEFMAICAETEGNMRQLLHVPDSHKVLFLQGGATLQFSAIPLNLLSAERPNMDYIVTGQWGEKAAKDLRGETKGSKIKGKMEVKWDSRDGLDGHQPTASRCDFYL
jgi:phosphoserine aminotransferase